MRQSSRMASVDVDFDAHPGAQGWQILIARLNPYSHRNALDNLHPVAARILGGQKRELLRRRRPHALPAGAMDDTFVTIPPNGARTTVCASFRAASSRCATASR